MFPEKKKKKVDYEALNSSLMRIPRMDVAAARSLLDLGVREIFELQGRAPEVLFEEARAKNPDIPEDRDSLFSHGSILCETTEPDSNRLHPDCWR